MNALIPPQSTDPVPATRTVVINNTNIQVIGHVKDVHVHITVSSSPQTHRSWELLLSAFKRLWSHLFKCP